MIAREVLVTAYRAGDRTVQDFVAGYAPRICSEQGLPSPDNEGVMEIVLRSLPPTTIFGVCVCAVFSCWYCRLLQAVFVYGPAGLSMIRVCFGFGFGRDGWPVGLGTSEVATAASNGPKKGGQWQL